LFHCDVFVVQRIGKPAARLKLTNFGSNRVSLFFFWHCVLLVMLPLPKQQLLLLLLLLVVVVAARSGPARGRGVRGPPELVLLCIVLCNKSMGIARCYETDVTKATAASQGVAVVIVMTPNRDVLMLVVEPHPMS
jgi:hypothetical protein